MNCSEKRKLFARFGFPFNSHLFRVSCLSASNKGDEVDSEAVNRSPDIYFTAEENPGKHQLGDHLMKIRLVRLRIGFIGNTL